MCVCVCVCVKHMNTSTEFNLLPELFLKVKNSLENCNAVSELFYTWAPPGQLVMDSRSSQDLLGLESWIALRKVHIQKPTQSGSLEWNWHR